jgi:hypothetical protein
VTDHQTLTSLGILDVKPCECSGLRPHDDRALQAAGGGSWESSGHGQPIYFACVPCKSCVGIRLQGTLSTLKASIRTTSTALEPLQPAQCYCLHLRGFLGPYSWSGLRSSTTWRKVIVQYTCQWCTETGTSRTASNRKLVHLHATIAKYVQCAQCQWR